MEDGYNGAYGDENKGIKFTPERAKRCGDSMRGKHHTEKTKAKLSAAGLGRVVSETTAEFHKGFVGKNVQPNRGRHRVIE